MVFSLYPASFLNNLEKILKNILLIINKLESSVEKKLKKNENFFGKSLHICNRVIILVSHILKKQVMENFETRMIGRKVKVIFDHPLFVSAKFKAQSCSFAIQGRWVNEVVSIPKDGYTLEKLEAKVNEGFNKSYY